MKSNANTNNFVRGSVQARDHTAHRRVYLDTYAKRRNPVQDVVVNQPASASAQQTQVPVAQPVQQTVPVQPKVITVPVQQSTIRPAEFVEQPPYRSTDFSAYSEPPVVESMTMSAPQPVASERSYLDTLTRRHATAVAAAPQAEDTVIESSLSYETQTLMDDPERDARHEANLRALYSTSLTDMIASNPKSASASHVRTIVASAFACGIMAVGMFTFIGQYDSQPVVAQPIGSPVIEVEPTRSAPASAPAPDSNASGPAAVNPEHPIRVVISSIGVNAPVEGLGTTPEGLIAVPKAYGIVGWYNKGAIPGKPGPAVLVGHYAGGGGAVFDKLGNLNDGDLITTTNGKGQSFTYRVTAKKEYHKDSVPMADIFKKSSESRLEIITCAGQWQAPTYSNRLVITAELVR